MNNYDRYDEALKIDAAKAAELALDFADGCASKASAWSWADRAVAAVPELADIAGAGSYPDTNTMRDRLAELALAPVIVTRHAGLVAWLEKRHGIMGDVIAHATPSTVARRHVIGALPLHLAALAVKVTTVDMPALAAELRGQDLTPEQMDEAGAELATYKVTRIY